MRVSFIAALLWAGGFVLNAVLLFVLLYRRRYRLVPWFTGWIAFEILYNVACFAVLHLGSRQLYKDVFWSCAFIEFLIQIAVVLEIAFSVLRRGGRWIEGARVRLLVAGGIAPAVALAMACFMTPAAETALDAWYARASLFITLYICLLFTSIMAASRQLGLAWRSHVMREGYGIAALVLAAFVTDTLHSYWRMAGSFSTLEQMRIVVYLGCLLYWIAAFWVPERAHGALPSEVRERLKALGVRMDYDVAESRTRME